MTPENTARCDKVAAKLLMEPIRRKIVDNSVCVYLGLILDIDDQGKSIGRKHVVVIVVVGEDDVLRFKMNHHPRAMEVFLATPFTRKGHENAES